MSRKRTKAQLRRLKLRRIGEHLRYYGSTGKEALTQKQEILLVQNFFLFWAFQVIVTTIGRLYAPVPGPGPFVYSMGAFVAVVLVGPLLRSYTRDPIHPVPRPR